MNSDTDGLTQRLCEVSLSENQGTLPSVNDQLKDESKDADCYIFNYQKFKVDEVLNRPGSDKDVERLKHTFNELKFNVCDCLNLGKEEALAVLTAATKKDYRQSKYFVCCFLTHEENGRLLIGDEYVKIDDILKLFSSSKCESLAGKPKIFIFQTCHGGCCGKGVPYDPANFDLVPHSQDYLDFLIVYSTYEGKVSSRNLNEQGTYFINELCGSLELFSETLDLLQILTITNYRVAYLSETYENKKQMPCFNSRLRTEVKFNKKSLGQKSTEKALEDREKYNTRNSEKFKFLSLINTTDNFKRDLISSAANLWSSVANKGYQREEKRNWSRKGLLEFLKNFAARDFSCIDCLVCFIACKTKRDYLCDVKGNKFLMKEIVGQFTGENCPTLPKKPKIFIFMLSSPPKKSWWPCFCPESTDDGSLIEHSDIIEVVITVQESLQLGVVAEKFCNIFGGESSQDFLCQLTKMNDELVQDCEFYSSSNRKMATFCFNSTLTKTLILNNT